MKQLQFKPPIIGREKDLYYLRQRLKNVGLTIIAAEPMMGKSYLMQHLHDELVEEGEYAVGASIGSANSDMFKDAFSGLYAQSLVQLNKHQQATQLYSLIKKSWPKALLKILPTAKEIFNQEDNSFAEAGQILVNALIGVQDNQSNQINRVDYDSAKCLSKNIHALNDKPQVLILDALEQLQNPHEQGKLIEQCAKELFQDKGWPPIHIIVCIRAPGDSLRTQEQEALEWAFRTATLSSCELHYFSPWEPKDDEWVSLIKYFEKYIEASDIIGALKGTHRHLLSIPGMVENILIRQPTLVVELEQCIQDCLSRTYIQLKDILEELYSSDKSLFELALRLLLLQELNVESWRKIRSLMFDHLADEIETLNYRKILTQQIPFPSFGHTTRFQFGLKYCHATWPTRLQEIAEKMAVELATAITKVDLTTIQYSQTILGLPETTGLASDTYKLLKVFNSRLWGKEDDFDVSLTGDSSAQLRAKCPMFCALSASNALAAAYGKRDLESVESYLNDLRNLSQEHIENIEIIITFANSLVFILSLDNNELNVSSRNIIESELRELAQLHNENDELQSLFANSLVTSTNLRKYASNISEMLHSLQEVRDLIKRNVENEGVYSALARGLCYVLQYSRDDADQITQDKAFQELRELAALRTINNQIQEEFSKALYNSLTIALNKCKINLRNSLLHQLRIQSLKYPTNNNIQYCLCIGLVNVLHEDQKTPQLSSCLSLLSELKRIVKQNSEWDKFQEQYAMGLFMVLNCSRENSNSKSYDSIFLDLLELASMNPEIEGVQIQFVMALTNDLIYALQTSNRSRFDLSLNRLHELANEFLDKTELQIRIYHGLGQAYVNSLSTPDIKVKPILLNELSAIAKRNPLNSRIMEMEKDLQTY